MEKRAPNATTDWWALGRLWANLGTVTQGIPAFFEPNTAALRGP